MKRSLKIKFLALVAVLILAGSAPRVFSQEPAKDGNVHSKYEGMDSPEPKSEEEQYLHSPVVQSIAKAMNIKTETASNIFLIFNSAIIWAGIIWLLVKVMPKAFRTRSGTIEKALVDARSATEEAKNRLSAVEARLAKLDSEIDAIRKQAEHDSAEDEKRIKALLEEERKRIVESAEQEIESFGLAAQRDLKRVAADLAVERALQRIHLGADADRILVQEFTSDLAGTKSNGGQN